MTTAVLLYHIIVFGRNKKPVFNGDHTSLYNIIGNSLRQLQCRILSVNGTSDHIHIGTYASPYISVDDLVEEICRNAAEFIENTKMFPTFESFSKDYMVLSCCAREADELKKEIDNQKLFHKSHTLEMELRSKGLAL